MCRFLVYKGREMMMSELLLKAEQSLVMQSYEARERREPLNGDGFGVGWYAPEVDPIPAVFTDVQPAWSNRNLFRLSGKIRSTHFFAHVRAASEGSFVNEFNCHPFQYEQFLWMHNGRIAGFPRIKRTLRASLRDDFYALIQGTTDTEHAFAVFLNQLAARLDDYTADDLRAAFLATIRQIGEWQAQGGIAGPTHLNFAVSDGFNVLVSRYVSTPGVEPPSLYISTGDRFEVYEGRYRMLPPVGHPEAVIIASEPLTAERTDWHPVPRNHLIMVSPELHIQQIPIPG